MAASDRTDGRTDGQHNTVIHAFATGDAYRSSVCTLQQWHIDLLARVPSDTYQTLQMQRVQLNGMISVRVMFVNEWNRVALNTLNRFNPVRSVSFES
jgi:hypothetical protein